MFLQTLQESQPAVQKLEQVKQLQAWHDGQQHEHDHVLSAFLLCLLFSWKEGEDEDHQVCPARNSAVDLPGHHLLEG